jgi:predicted DNA-binding transcriptional regulator AlpA
MNKTVDFFLLQKELEQLLGSVVKLNLALLNASYPEFMPVKLAGRYLGLSASHLNKLRSTGGGPTFCDFGPKAVRYRRADLDTWAEAHRCAHTAQKQSKTSKVGAICARA